MKTLYIECNMGAAGDMLMGALLELIEDKEAFINKMNNLKIPNVNIASCPSIKCGITGTHVSVKIDGEEETEKTTEHNHKKHCHGHEHKSHHHHATMESISVIIDKMNISEKVKKDIKDIYKIIAEAESQVHGTPVTEIHFHEVGMMDAIADITGCCLLMDEISPDRIVVSPIKTGFGHVHCAHGIMPVPAPATAMILKGIPNSAGSIEGELCTPTGAAIIKYFADEYSYQPEMIIERIGYGMGNKNFPSANCVRAILGDMTQKNERKSKKNDTDEEGNVVQELKDTVVELCCNLDDMTPEEIGYATEILRNGKALDVYTIPISMKKSRPGVLLSVLCHTQDKEEIIKNIFRHTTTIGVRVHLCERYVLKRSIGMMDTKLGPVRVKKSEGYGVKREKIEFDDIKKMAKERGRTLLEIKSDIL